MSDEDGGCCGCIISLAGLIAIGVVLWALIFGFTIGGETYNCASCNCSQGVVLEPEHPRVDHPEPPAPQKLESQVIIIPPDEAGMEMEEEVINVPRIEEVDPPPDAEWE